MTEDYTAAPGLLSYKVYKFILLIRLGQQLVHNFCGGFKGKIHKTNWDIRAPSLCAKKGANVFTTPIIDRHEIAHNFIPNTLSNMRGLSHVHFPGTIKTLVHIPAIIGTGFSMHQYDRSQWRQNPKHAQPQNWLRAYHHCPRDWRHDKHQNIRTFQGDYA